MDSPLSAADLLLTSQAVFTGLDKEPVAATVAVAGDRICWVGPADQVPPELRGPATIQRDLGDALLMPGFHDAHLHFFHSALYLSPLAERFCGENEADAVARLAPLAARRPAGSWLLAQGWRDYLWSPAGMPSRASLDAAYPDRPVAMYSGDAHTLWLLWRAWASPRRASRRQAAPTTATRRDISRASCARRQPWS